LFVVDLAPKKMVGKLSEGMRFDIGYAAGRQPVLAVPEKGGSQGMKEPMRDADKQKRQGKPAQWIATRCY